MASEQAKANGLKVWFRLTWRDDWQALGVVATRAEAAKLVADRITAGDFENCDVRIMPARGEFVVSRQVNNGAPWVEVGRYPTRDEAAARINDEGANWTIQFVHATPPAQA